MYHRSQRAKAEMWKAPAGGPGPSLVVLLLCSLVLSGVLAYQAQDAARSHRAVSESALRDYAALARDELARHLEDELRDMAEETLGASLLAERRRGADARLVEFAEEVREEMGRCGCPGLVHDFFSLELSNGMMRMREETVEPAVREWIADTVRAHVAMEHSGRREMPRAPGRRDGRQAPGQLTTAVLRGEPGRSLLFAGVREDDGGVLRVYGVVLERTAFVTAIARGIVADVALLPPSLTTGAPDEAMVSVTVSGDGMPLFHSGGAVEAETEVTDTLRTALGDYELSVGVRPEMADKLVIGGLPHSRLPLLLGIFLLTLGLSAIAIVQLRRQQALVRLRSSFIASVSHELRTPLAQIRLFSDLLASGRLQEEQRARSVRIIGEEAQRLAYLVENVLRFSRAEQRLDRLAPERTDLAALTREIVDAFVPLAHARHARIETALASDAIADLDHDAVRQVLLNLLDNAVKYGPPGQTVRVAVDREGARVRLTVDDQGTGIPPADRGAVWEPYHRLPRETDAATGGSGIGLAVVRDLVALHGGEVAVVDAPGGGARFLAWFPASPRPRPAASGVPA